IGQRVSVSVPDNLLISLSPDGGWTDCVNVDLQEVVKELTNGDPKPFTEDSQFYLLPASTYDGTEGTVYETGSANNDGSAADNAVFMPGHKICWNKDTSAFEGHWIDVPLYFKTDSQSSVSVALSQEGTKVTSVGEENGSIVNTVRAAFLNKECTAPSTGTEPLVFAPSSSTGVFKNEIILSPTERTAPKYLSFTGGKSTELFKINPNGENPVKCITVRIWIEGQDESCVAQIGGKTFSLSLKFLSVD
ncbi:MAG: hypothetical protein PUC29_04395, partial [Clostridia bacterium]|nr:hypothetical protein [Clostridia bacterium]